MERSSKNRITGPAMQINSWTRNLRMINENWQPSAVKISSHLCSPIFVCFHSSPRNWSAPRRIRKGGNRGRRRAEPWARAATPGGRERLRLGTASFPACADGSQKAEQAGVGLGGRVLGHPPHSAGPGGGRPPGQPLHGPIRRAGGAEGQEEGPGVTPGVRLLFSVGLFFAWLWRALTEEIVLV